MIKFEYKEESFPSLQNLQKTLNGFGEEGWLVVKLTYVPYRGSALGRNDQWTAVMARPVEGS